MAAPKWIETDLPSNCSGTVKNLRYRAIPCHCLFGESTASMFAVCGNVTFCQTDCFSSFRKSADDILSVESFTNSHPELKLPGSAEKRIGAEVLQDEKIIVNTIKNKVFRKIIYMVFRSFLFSCFIDSFRFEYHPYGVALRSSLPECYNPDIPSGLIHLMDSSEYQCLIPFLSPKGW